MATIVSGNGLGLLNTSLYVLGSPGGPGQAAQGRAGAKVYVNAATGNLVAQNVDEVLQSGCQSSPHLQQPPSRAA